jgi:threonine dehydratase
MDGSAASEDAAEFAREHGHYFLDDVSDALVPAGTATIAAEVFDEVPEPDIVFVPMGDTALIRGVAVEAKRRRSRVRIIGVQTEQAPAYVRSWQQGRVVIPDECNTIADGLASLRPLEANVVAIRELVDEVRLVSESELLDAICILLLDEHVLRRPPVCDDGDIPSGSIHLCRRPHCAFGHGCESVPGSSSSHGHLEISMHTKKQG